MKWTIVVLCLIIICFGGMEFYLHYGLKEKTAYVITTELHEKFQLTGELDKKMKKIEQTRKNILDSLMNILQMQQKSIELNNGKDEKLNQEFEISKDDYLQKKKQFDAESEGLSRQYFDQTWTQLNEYIQEYGRKKEYKYIFGATGQGALMYANDKDNVTKEIIEYVNQCYNDKDK